MAEEEKDQHGAAGGGGKDEHGEEHGKGHKGHKSHGPGHGGGHEEHGGVAEWLISFADNVALLMGFFVILLAMNMNKPKPAHGLGGDSQNPSGDDSLMELVYGIREAFHTLPRLDSKDPKDVPLLEYMARRSRGETSTSGSIGLKRTQAAIRPSDYEAPTGAFSFEPYSTVIDSAGKELAINLAKNFRGQTFILQIRGHTSAIEAAAGPQAALKLSFQRAQAVAELLAQSGLKWENLRLVACGDQERITPLASDRAEHKTNQRVEIVLTNEAIPADPHVAEPR
jgi:chemotaxis protein MotB